MNFLFSELVHKMPVELNISSYSTKFNANIKVKFIIPVTTRSSDKFTIEVFLKLKSYITLASILVTIVAINIITIIVIIFRVFFVIILISIVLTILVYGAFPIIFAITRKKQIGWKSGFESCYL